MSDIYGTYGGVLVSTTTRSITAPQSTVYVTASSSGTRKGIYPDSSQPPVSVLSAASILDSISTSIPTYVSSDITTSYVATVTSPPRVASTSLSNSATTPTSTATKATSKSTEPAYTNIIMIATGGALSFFSIICLLIAIYLCKRSRRHINPKTALPSLRRRGTLPPELEGDRVPGLQEIDRGKRLSRHELGGKEIGTRVGWLRLKFGGGENTSADGKVEGWGSGSLGIMASELPGREEH
jgi:hypothetical protein